MPTVSVDAPDRKPPGPSYGRGIPLCGSHLLDGPEQGILVDLAPVLGTQAPPSQTVLP